MEITNKKIETKHEPLLDDPTRYVLFPIKYNSIWNAYKELQSTFWTAEETDFEPDVDDFRQKLTDDERFYISTILGFFASADCIVNLNLLSNFGQEVTAPECLCFFGFQAAQEQVHSEVYSLLIDRYIDNHEEKERLFNAIETIPAVKSKAEWALQWLDPEKHSFAVRICGWAIVEGLMFAASFAAIAWFKHRNLLKCLGETNEWIARDESLHCSFACLLLREYITNRPSTEQVHEMFRQAIAHEINFVTTSLPVRLIGMNADDMVCYVKYMGNRLLKDMNYPPLYTKKEAYCPWEWINLLSVEGASNFFERKISDYARSTIKKSQIEFNNEF